MSNFISDSFHEWTNSIGANDTTACDYLATDVKKRAMYAGLGVVSIAAAPLVAGGCIISAISSVAVVALCAIGAIFFWLNPGELGELAIQTFYNSLCISILYLPTVTSIFLGVFTSPKIADIIVEGSLSMLACKN